MSLSEEYKRGWEERKKSEELYGIMLKEDVDRKVKELKKRFKKYSDINGNMLFHLKDLDKEFNEVFGLSTSEGCSEGVDE